MAKRQISDAEILAQVPAARARERRERKEGVRASTVRYDRSAHRIVLEFRNGMLFAFPIDLIGALRNATRTELSSVELDPSGSALRFDSLDVDLSVPGLVLSAVGESDKRRHFAGLLGRTSSIAKRMAARANGAKGGRPAKRSISATRK